MRARKGSGDQGIGRKRATVRQIIVLNRRFIGKWENKVVKRHDGVVILLR